MPIIIGSGYKFDRFVPISNLLSREHVVFNAVPWRVKQIKKIKSVSGLRYQVTLENPNLRDYVLIKSGDSMIQLAHSRNLKFPQETTGHDD